jgi:superoxide dismutase, Cu-Zn family
VCANSIVAGVVFNYGGEEMQKSVAVAVAVATLVLGACAGLQGGQAGGGGQEATASANLRPTKGNTVAGTVTFREAGNRVTVRADVSGLKANSEFGFHVHEKGDCSAPDAASAGGHFNPDGKAHGQPSKGEHHAGDMPNLRSNADGIAELTYETSRLTVRPGPASVVGRAVVVHANPDDYKTQPAGDSGARTACGVVVSAAK